MKTINKFFYSALILSIFSLLFVSCEKESIHMNTQIDEMQLQISEIRSSSAVDSLFRFHLNHLADMFNNANDASNGDLELLLESLDTLSSSAAFTVLDNSGLINVTQLENAINHTAYYEDLLLLSYSQEDIENIVNIEAGDLQELFGRPFWGEDCDYVSEEPVGMPDDKCYILHVGCRKYRFWIGFGSTYQYVTEVDCP
ncbi:MAG: hypothetical protein EA362_07130 [Saprospirales bacterium]|nr:MAG: hypothetical protein EA362_07130 [Saprospirales bacterium]